MHRLSVFNRSTPAGLVANILVPILAVVLGNGLIFSLGWNRGATQVNPSFAPPGYVVGIIWVILFGLMGTARWLVLRAKTSDVQRHTRWIDGLIVLCFAYPFYTLGLSNRELGLAGNIVTLVLASWVVYQVRTSSKAAAMLLATLILWVSFATVIVVRTMQLNP